MEESMSETESATVVRLEAAQAALRDHFLGWQCRLRQMAMREAGGRPTSGMQPAVTVAGEAAPLGQITVLVVKQAPEATTAQFRHIVRRTLDPIERWESGVGAMQAGYYQQARDFDDRLTALFGPDSRAVRRLLRAGRCRLEFDQYGQRYLLPCAVAALPESDPAFQATYWHNSLFNPNLPPGVQVLGFTPDWAHAQADPPIP